MIRTGSRVVISRAWGQGALVLNGDKVSVWEDVKVLETQGGDSHTTRVHFVAES